MSNKLIRQIVFGAAGLWLLWGAWEAYAQVGVALRSGLPAGAAVVLLVLAFTAKGG